MDQQASTNTLIIIRGLPGSGKTTLANAFIESLKANNTVKHFENDNYFIGSDGVYRFDKSKLHDAHLATFHHFCAEMKDALKRFGIVPGTKPFVFIVSNTFTQRWEASPYIMYAQAHGFQVKIIEPNSPWKSHLLSCYEKCTHNVPLDMIRAMANRYESHEGWLE